MSTHDAAAAQPSLPSLDGITLLSADEQVTGALQSLVLDRLLGTGGEAVWIDSHNNAATTRLARIAPSLRTLERVTVARAFTPYQHASLVADLASAVTPATELLVLPLVDWFYADDTLRAGEGETMLEQSLDRVAAVATERSIPVVLTREAECGLGERVAERCDEVLTCHRSQFGPRFSGSDVETLVYREHGGVQTTFAFWRAVLAERHPDPATPTPEVGIRGTH